VRLLSVLAFLALSACASAVDDEDAGVAEGEGEGEPDAGFVDAGGEGEGEGEGEGDIPICDGGVCDDAGIAGEEYEGAPENGVVCGAQSCVDAEAMCCVTADFAGIDGKCVSDASECSGGLINATFLCDGPEDCVADVEECCLHEDITSTCVPLGACQSNPDNTDSVVCLDTTGCLAGELCCGLDVEFEVPVDMGTCTNEEDDCQAQTP
jgi:hypothetical protein